MNEHYDGHALETVEPVMFLDTRRTSNPYIYNIGPSIPQRGISILIDDPLPPIPQGSPLTEKNNPAMRSSLSVLASNMKEIQ